MLPCENFGYGRLCQVVEGTVKLVCLNARGGVWYGALPKQIGRHKYDNIGSVERRLALYKKDRNREHLVDIANLCLVEFVVHPELPFIAADDGEHTQKKRKEVV